MSKATDILAGDDFEKIVRGMLPIQTHSLEVEETTVEAGSSARVSVKSKQTFRAEKLEIPATVASDFLIEEILVGGVSQKFQQGTLPGVLFSELLPFGMRLKMDTCLPDETMTIVIRNQASESRKFKGKFLGLEVSSKEDLK